MELEIRKLVAIIIHACTYAFSQVNSNAVISLETAEVYAVYH